jgi:hypothetical protein
VFLAMFGNFIAAMLGASVILFAAWLLAGGGGRPQPPWTNVRSRADETRAH